MRTIKEKDIQPLTGVEFDVEEMTKNIVTFSEKMAGIEFFPYQREYAEGIVKSVIQNDGEELTALFARQSGKTETNAVIADGIMVILPLLAKLFSHYEPIQIYRNGVRVGVFAPSGRQAQTTYGRMDTRIRSRNAKMILNSNDIDVGLEDLTRVIALDNGSIAISLSANKNAQIESETLHFIIVEEAQDVDSMVVRKSIHPMGASTNATVIKVGTANNVKSDFLDAIRRNRRRNEEENRQLHFEYDYKEVQKYNDRYRKYIKQEIRRLGKNSDEFRMAYGCEFILERGMFLTESKFNELCEIERNLPLVHERKRGVQTAGIDIAKKSDSTVITVTEIDYDNPVYDDIEGVERYRKRILDWLELKGDDYNSQFYQIVEFLEKFNISTVYIDSTGGGEIMSDRIKGYFDGRIDVVSYTFSRKSKSKMYKHLNQEIHANRLLIPSGSRVTRYKKYRKFKQQMLDLEKDWKGQYLIVSHPMKKDAHDDYADSLALAIMASKNEAMPELEVQDYNPFFEDKGYRSYGKKKKAGRTNSELFG
jgi:hypothetical protein